MNKKSWKYTLIIVLLIILVFCVRLFINLKTVYIGNNTKIISVGSKIIKIKNNSRILFRRVNIYKNNKKTNGYLKSSKGDIENEYYLVSLNNKTIDIYPVIASGSMANINVITQFKDDFDSDKLDELNNILDTKLERDNIIKYKEYSIDIENDNNDEKIVYVSYVLNNTVCCKIFIIDDSTYNIVDYEFKYEDLAEKTQKSYSLVGLIDFNNDNKYKIVVSRVDGNTQPQYYDIYSYENGSIKEIK